MAPWTAPCAAGRLAVRVVDETSRGGPCIFRCVCACATCPRGTGGFGLRRTRTLRTHVDAAAVAASWKRDGACRTCKHMHAMASSQYQRTHHPICPFQSYSSSAASIAPICMSQCQSRLASFSNRMPLAPYRDLSTR